MLIIMVIQIRNGNKSIHTDKEKLKEAITQAIDESGYENKSPTILGGRQNAKVQQLWQGSTVDGGVFL